MLFVRYVSFPLCLSLKAQSFDSKYNVRMSDSKVSIIIPVYNTERYLAECVNSVCTQTHRNLEIIIIDDGSTDKSGEIADQLAKNDVRIKVFHQDNMGLSKARNIGLDKATGDFVGFVDSDDWIDVDLIENSLKRISKDKADVAVCKTVLAYSGKKCQYGSEFPWHCISNYSEKVKLVLSLTPFQDSTFSGGQCWKKIVRREILRNIRFPEDRLLCEDEIFTLMIYKEASRITFNSKSSCYYRMRSGSIVHDRHFVFKLLRARLLMVEMGLISPLVFMKSNLKNLNWLASYNLAIMNNWELEVYKKTIAVFSNNKSQIFNIDENCSAISKFYSCFIVITWDPLVVRQRVANVLYRIKMKIAKEKNIPFLADYE